MLEAVLIRKLGGSELFYAKSAMSVLAIAHIQGGLHLGAIEQALAYLTKKYELLSCRLAQVEEDYFFAKQDPSTIPLCLWREVTLEERLKVIRDELNTPLDLQNNFMRVTILTHQAGNLFNSDDTEIIFNVFGGMVDSEAYTPIIGEFFAVYVRFVNAELVLEPELIPIIPAIDDYLPSRVKCCKKEILLCAMEEKFSQLKPIALAVEEGGSKNGSRDFIGIELTRAQTNAIVANAKKNKATIQGALIAAHLLAIRKNFNESLSEQDMLCRSVVNLRHHVIPPIEAKYLLSTTAAYLGAYKVSATTNLWQLAQQVIEDIRCHISDGEALKQQRLYEEIFVNPAWPVAMSMINLGRVELPDTFGDIKLVSIHTLIGLTMPCIQLAVVTFNGKMILNYMYMHPWQSEETVQALAVSALQSLIKETK